MGTRQRKSSSKGIGNQAERGTATVEFVAVLPALMLATLISIQMIAAGFSLWSASVAARAGARAAHLGSDPAASVRSALPEPMRAEARVRHRAGVVTARVPVPQVLPFLPPLRVEASSGLEAGG